MSALKNQVAFFLNFGINYSTLPEAIIWVQQTLLAVVHTTPWPAILLCKTTLVLTSYVKERAVIYVTEIPAIVLALQIQLIMIVKPGSLFLVSSAM